MKRRGFRPTETQKTMRLQMRLYLNLCAKVNDLCIRIVAFIAVWNEHFTVPHVFEGVA